jgi:hypothetical protein
MKLFYGYKKLDCLLLSLQEVKLGNLLPANSCGTMVQHLPWHPKVKDSRMVLEVAQKDIIIENVILTYNETLILSVLLRVSNVM